MTKQECIARLEMIASKTPTVDGIYVNTAYAKDWVGGDKNRTYFKIFITKYGKAFKEIDYGYLDNVTCEYFPKRMDLRGDYTATGNSF